MNNWLADFLDSLAASTSTSFLALNATAAASPFPPSSAAAVTADERPPPKSAVVSESVLEAVAALRSPSALRQEEPFPPAKSPPVATAGGAKAKHWSTAGTAATDFLPVEPQQVSPPPLRRASTDPAHWASSAGSPDLQRALQVHTTAASHVRSATAPFSPGALSSAMNPSMPKSFPSSPAPPSSGSVPHRKFGGSAVPAGMSSSYSVASLDADLLSYGTYANVSESSNSSLASSRAHLSTPSLIQEQSSREFPERSHLRGSSSYFPADPSIPYSSSSASLLQGTLSNSGSVPKKIAPLRHPLHRQLQLDNPMPTQDARYSNTSLYESTIGSALRTANRFLSAESFQIISLCLLWYASSAVSNSLAKEIFVVYRYPVTLTYVQFAFVAVCCFLFGYFAGDPRHLKASAGVGGSVEESPSLLPSFQTQPLFSTFSPFPTNLSWNTPSGIWKKLIPFPRVRQVLGIVFFGILWLLTRGWRILRRTTQMLRYWVALGLGIHDDPSHHHHHGHHHHHHPHRDVDRFFSGTRIIKPNREIISTMMPLAGFLIFGHIFSSIAISNVPVSFVHTIKALSPLFTVLVYRFLYQTQYPEQVYISLVPLTVGVMLACSFELAFNFIGLFCSLISTFIFVGQNIFSKGLFKDKKLDKLNMLLYSSSSSFVLMMPIWLWSEGFDIVMGISPIGYLTSDTHRETHYPSFSVFLLFIANGLTHFCQNVFAFSILSLVTPVTYSIASLIKRIVVIVVSMIWFGQHMSQIQAVGVVLTFVGLWMYRGAKMLTVDGGISKLNSVGGGGGGISPKTEETVLDVVIRGGVMKEQQQHAAPRAHHHKH